MSADVVVRVAGEADFDLLTEIWRRAARSTHAFMGDDALDDLAPRIRDLLLPSMDVRVAIVEGQPVGFLGARDDDHVELLYIAPEAQGHGIGPMLLRQLGAGRGPRSVEVYAGNTVGLGFYRSQGFHEVRRDPTDLAGRPFAIVHLERET